MFSIAIYCYLLYSLIGSDAFSKKNALILQKDIENLKTFWYEINENNFFFDCQLSDYQGNGYLVDASIFTFQVVYYNFVVNLTMKGNILESYEKDDMVLCRDSPIGKGLPASVLQQYPNGLCLANPRLRIGGYFDEERTSYMEISLARCNNDTSNDTCKP